MIRGVPNTDRKARLRDNSSATSMLGLEVMAVLAVSQRDGEFEYAIETTAATGWCPGLLTWRPCPVGDSVADLRIYGGIAAGSRFGAQ